MRPPPARAGAALVMAMVVLAMLLLLGLPLLLNQSASLSGSVLQRQRQSSATGSASAESLGIALAAYAQAWHLTAHDLNPDLAIKRSALIADLQRLGGDPSRDALAVQDDGQDPLLMGGYQASIQPLMRHRVLARIRQLDTGIRATGDEPLEHTDLSVLLTDESGRLDVNSLDAAGWHAVIQTVLGNAWWDPVLGGYRNETVDDDGNPVDLTGITPDWDDGTSGDPSDPLSGLPYDSQDLSGFDIPGNGLDDDGDGSIDEDPPGAVNGDGDDDDDWGELAEELARHRYGLPGGRYTDLEQLLDADPGHNKQEPPATSVYGTADIVSGSWGFRHPLTPAELERLRPYLTVLSTAPGRAGEADLGTVIAQHDNDPSSGPPTRAVIDGPIEALGAPGSTLLGGTRQSDGRRARVWERGDSWRDSRTGPDPDAGGLAVGSAVALQLRSPVNLNVLPAALDSALLGTQVDWPRQVEGDLGPDGGSVARLVDLAAVAVFDRSTPADPLDVVDLDLWPLSRPLRELGGEARDAIPLALRSAGLFRIEAGASTTDQLDRSQADVGREGLWQCLPQEGGLAQRWDAQDEFQALIDSRLGARLVSGPLGVERLTSLRPAGVLWSESLVAPPALRWRTEPDLAGVEPLPPQIAREWRVCFQGQDKDSALANDKVTPPVSASNAASLTESAFGPEGLDCSSAGPTWMVDGHAESAWPKATASPLQDEIAGRQLSFWLRPDFLPGEDWNAGEPRVIWTLGGRSDRQMPWWDGTTGLDLSHHDRLKLLYDPEIRCFILEAAPSTQIQRIPYGFQIPVDDPNTLYDDRCLGNDAAGTVKLDPAVIEPALGEHIRHYTYVGDGGLETDRWYHLQVFFTALRPGQIGVVVDGIAGRDTLRLPSTTALAPGDFWTSPSFTLPEGTSLSADNLSTPSAPTGGGGQWLRLTDLPLHGGPLMRLVVDEAGYSSFPWNAILPTHGSIWLDDEAIAYRSLDANGLVDCTRAVRQDHWLDRDSDRANPDPDLDDELYRWPILQDHRPLEARGMSGGLRLRPDTSDPLRGRLLAGGALTVAPFAEGDPLGDPSRPPGMENRYRHWGAITASHSLDSASPPGTTLTLAGWTSELPPAGILRIVSDDGTGPEKYFLYEALAGSVVTGRVISEAEGALVGLPVGAGTLAIGPTDPATAWLVSIEVTNGGYRSWTCTAEIDDPSHFAQSPAELAAPTAPDPDLRVGPDYLRLLQIEHRTTGRIEWLAYDRTVSLDGRRFFIDLGGFDDASRGRERTLFRPMTLVPADAALDPLFPPGSQILPVQTLVSKGHRVRTGDAVSIIPADPDPGLEPHQALIRYGAEDGIPEHWHPSSATVLTGADVRDQFFAFTAPLTRPWGASLNAPFEMLIGAAWCGRDLSPSQWVDHDGLRHASPRLSWMIPPTGQASWSFSNEVMSVDALQSGVARGQVVGDAGSQGVVDYLGSGPSLDATALDVEFRVDVPVTGETGLALLDGEVVAWERREVAPSDQRLFIVGRGLLGSMAREHRIWDTLTHEVLTSSLTTITTYPTFTPLPIGPVEVLADALPAIAPLAPIRCVDGGLGNRWAEHPSMLLARRDGSAYEVARLVRSPQGDVFYPVPWLRGLYHSTPLDFAAGDLVIGHWPRHPSALPATSILPPAWPVPGSGGLTIPSPGSHPAWDTMPDAALAGIDGQDAMLRCRSFAWLGLPMRLRGVGVGAALAQARLDGLRYSELPLALVPREAFDDAGGRFTAVGRVLSQYVEPGAVHEEPLALVDLDLDGSDDHWMLPASAAVHDGFFAVADWLRRSNVAGVEQPIEHFSRRDTDGLEVRIHWRYADAATLGQGDLSTIADPVDRAGAAAAWLAARASLGNRSPSIGAVELRCNAPTMRIGGAPAQASTVADAYRPAAIDETDVLGVD